MNSLSLTPSSPACNSSTLSNLKPPYTRHHHHSHIHVTKIRRIRTGRCKASLLHEAPFAAAIGACVFNSLISPIPVGPHDKEDGESMMDSADARFAVMGIISFIPYFNWMSWVFAWMDTEDKRYVVYAIVYLAPYLRSNLSLLADESWLPIASILTCILHVQLEASIKNGDIRNLPLFNGKKDEQKVPFVSDELRNRIRGFGIPKKHTGHVEHLEEDEEEGKEQ